LATPTDYRHATVHDPGIQNLEGGPNADIIDPLASPLWESLPAASHPIAIASN
jgi:hypothetical protein